MERLWAPWRLEYVQAPGSDTCIFCLGEESEDEGRLVLFRGRYCFVIMNRFPNSNGHLMVAPLRHVADPGALALSGRRAAEVARTYGGALEQALGAASSLLPGATGVPQGKGEGQG